MNQKPNPLHTAMVLNKVDTLLNLPINRITLLVSPNKIKEKQLLERACRLFVMVKYNTLLQKMKITPGDEYYGGNKFKIVIPNCSYIIVCESTYNPCHFTIYIEPGVLLKHVFHIEGVINELYSLGTFLR